MNVRLLELLFSNSASNDVATQYLRNHLNKANQPDYHDWTIPQGFILTSQPFFARIIRLDQLNGKSEDTNLFFAIHQKYKKVCYFQNEYFKLNENFYKFNYSILIRPCNKQPYDLHAIAFEQSQMLGSGSSGKIFSSVGTVHLFQTNEAYFEPNESLVVKKSRFIILRKNLQYLFTNTLSCLHEAAFV